MKDLKKLAEDLDILDHVEFIGKLPNEQVKSMVRSALALVAPSRWNDPLGYVVLEAASVRTCSIVSKMGGLPEAAGPHGLLFENENVKELANCMKNFLENPQEALNRGERVYHYMTQTFSTETTVDQFIEICYKIQPTLAQL
jgi:glycosyltransferase involved in cell wall biosynthesis